MGFYCNPNEKWQNERKNIFGVLKRKPNIVVICFFFLGLIVDQTGSYVYSFYMTGAVLMVAFLIPMVLIPINHRKARVRPLEGHSKDDMVTAKSKAPETGQDQTTLGETPT